MALIFFISQTVYDRDAANQKSDDENSITAPNTDSTKEVQKRTQTFYQVLIDSRDIPFIRAQTEAVTFLGSNQENSRSLYAIPGLDYVSVAHATLKTKFLAEASNCCGVSVSQRLFVTRFRSQLLSSLPNVANLLSGQSHRRHTLPNL